MLWSDGRKSWLRDVHLPKKVEEIVQSQQDYTLQLLDVVEFGQRRSELQLLTGKRRENDELPVGQNIVSRYCVFVITETIYIAINRDYLLPNLQINSIIYDKIYQKEMKMGNN